MGQPSTNALQRLTEVIVDRHHACGHAAELLTLRCSDADAVDRIVEIVRPTSEDFGRRMQRLEASPFAQRFDSIHDGARQIGCRAVLTGAIASTTIGELDGRARGLDRFTFWRGAIATGMLAMVGAALDRSHEDEAFAAGFFSALGPLLLSRYAPDAFEQALRVADADGADFDDAAARVFGFPQSQLLSAVASRWRLPEWLVDAVAHPVAVGAVGAQAHTLGGLVCRARLVARARGFGGAHEGLQFPPDDLRWLTDPLLLAFDRVGGDAWLEAGVGGIFAVALPDGDEGRSPS